VRARGGRARFLVLLVLALLGASAVACRRPAPAAAGKRYALTGTVVSVDPAQRTVTIAHHDIPGFMPAMTMPFVVLEKDAASLAAVAPGDEVKASLVNRDSRYWLEDLVVVRKGTPPPTAASPAPRVAMPGEAIPSVTLVDQTGRSFRLDALRGKAYALTFIYTRCPLPDYCPLMMRNFQRAQTLLLAEPELFRRTRLLSVSFDPEHDTPGRLRSYGAPFQRARPPFAQWTLATGEPRAILSLGEALELQYLPRDRTFTHNLRTAVVGPDGKLRCLFRGNSWKPEELVTELRKALS
jgi:protein SCO1/2